MKKEFYMKKLTKLFGIVGLALIIGFLMPACSSDGDGGGSYDVMVDLGVAFYGLGDSFMLTVKDAIESYAVGKANVEIVDSDNSQSTQNDQIDQFILDEVDAMAINLVDNSDAVVGAIIAKAREANIPVVFFNREPSQAEMAKWNKLYYVGSDAADSGRMQGEIAYDYWTANKDADRNGDGTIQYLMFKGEAGHSDATLRTQYSIKYLTDKGVKVECLEEYTANWSDSAAKTKMTEYFSKYGDKIEMVFCNNDSMALGVIDALLAAGYFQDGKYMPVMGVDATSPAIKAIEDGRLLGTVLNPARSQGIATFDLAYALAANKNLSDMGLKVTNGKYVWVPYEKVTRNNYKNYQ